MIKKLDIFILKKYFTVFFFIVFAMILIFCAIDFTEKNDNFMRNNAPYSAVFLDYYFNLIPAIANYLSPLLVFISTIIVTSVMASHTEVIAILSSGVSYNRFLWSFFMGAALLALMIFYLIGWLIPNANEERVAFEVKYIENKYHFDARDVHFRIDPDTYAYLQSYNNDINVGYQFTLETFDGKQLVSKLSTHRVEWDSLDSKWKMSSYTLRTYKDGVEEVSVHPSSDTTLNLYPTDFQNRHNFEQTMTIPELREYIAVQKMRGLENIDIYVIEYYDRLAYPFAIIILTMMGVVVASNKSREGVAFQIVTGVLLAVAYFITLQLGRVFVADGVVHPAIGSWIPNIIFIFIGLYLYWKAPK